MSEQLAANNKLPREQSERGFTPSLKFALGGPHRALFALRTFITRLRDGFHISPRQDGMPLPAKANSSAGFTLMLAALIASVALALGTSIFALAQKELTLSSVGRDSQFAFYAADSGAECALYWDLRFQLFPTTTPASKQLSCDNEQKTTTATNVGGKVVSVFEYEPNGYCAKVTVTKSNTSPHTVIHVDGYNTLCGDIQTSSRALERSVELKY